jgi:hypothetical protein
MISIRDASRLQPCKTLLGGTLLVLLQFTYVLGIGAMTAQAGNDPPDARPPAVQPVSTDASMPQAQNDTPVLSPEAERVSRIAVQNGDKEFIMVDKAQGELILFRNGKPTYSAPALTGASMGDRVPPIVLTFGGMHPLTLEQKVTPAGRFTVYPEADPDYGKVWTLNEIHGKDWDFAIHQVFLGSPAEHREARLHSTNVADHHATWGCINVEPRTIQVLSRQLPKKGRVPLYILPNDESLVAALFPLRELHAAPIEVTKSATTAVRNTQLH